MATKLVHINDPDYTGEPLELLVSYGVPATAIANNPPQPTDQSNQARLEDAKPGATEHDQPQTKKGR